MTWEEKELPELQELFLEVKPNAKLSANSSDEIKAFCWPRCISCQTTMSAGATGRSSTRGCLLGTLLRVDGTGGGCRTGQAAAVTAFDSSRNGA